MFNLTKVLAKKQDSPELPRIDGNIFSNFLHFALHFPPFHNIYMYGIQENYQYQDHRKSIETTDVRHVKRKSNIIDAGQKHTAQLH